MRFDVPRAESKHDALARKAREHNRGNNQQNRENHHYVNYRDPG